MNIEQFVFLGRLYSLSYFFLPLGYLMLVIEGGQLFTIHGEEVSAMTALGHLGEVQKSVVFSSKKNV